MVPKFCKTYADVGGIIGGALQEYRDDVASGAFPGPRYSPYKIAPEESAALAAALREEGLAEAAEAAEAGAAQQ